LNGYSGFSIMVDNDVYKNVQREYAIYDLLKVGLFEDK
jgi:hypothetical protein